MVETFFLQQKNFSLAFSLFNKSHSEQISFHWKDEIFSVKSNFNCFSLINSTFNSSSIYIVTPMNILISSTTRELIIL